MSPLHGVFRKRLVVITTITTIAALAVVTSADGRKSPKHAEEWKAPARAARKKNPVPVNKPSLEAGRKVYAAECADCHGPRGGGDGPGARDLKDPVPSLADARVWGQSDGELFWKLSTGRGDMPGFDDMLDDEDRWHVLNYARATFGGKSQARAGEGKDARVATSRGEQE
jgi:mono/diheme cytochrome c family protein